MTRVKRTLPAVEYAPDWLTPIEPDRPCGPDLEYDRAFVLLRDQAMTKADVQYGDFVEDSPPVNWSAIERDCRQLMARTRDMRVALLFVRCRVRQAGAAGLAEGLGLLAAWLKTFPQTLHPCEEDSGDGDAILDIRRNVLQELTDPNGLLADVRDIMLVRSTAMPLQVRDVEQGGSVADATVREQVRRQLADLKSAQPDVVSAVAQAAAHVSAIETWVTVHLGANAPDLSSLRILLRQVLEPIVPDARDVPDEVDELLDGFGGMMLDDGVRSPGEEPLGSVHEPRAPMDRPMVRAMLGQIRAWFELNEPSSPIAVLLWRAEQCVGMRYVELTQALPPDLVAHWESERKIE